MQPLNIVYNNTIYITIDDDSDSSENAIAGKNDFSDLIQSYRLRIDEQLESFNEDYIKSDNSLDTLITAKAYQLSSSSLSSFLSKSIPSWKLQRCNQYKLQYQDLSSSINECVTSRQFDIENFYDAMTKRETIIYDTMDKCINNKECIEFITENDFFTNDLNNFKTLIDPNNLYNLCEKEALNNVYTAWFLYTNCLTSENYDDDDVYENDVLSKEESEDQDEYYEKEIIKSIPTSKYDYLGDFNKVDDEIYGKFDNFNEDTDESDENVDKLDDDYKYFVHNINNNDYDYY